MHRTRRGAINAWLAFALAQLMRADDVIQ